MLHPSVSWITVVALASALTGQHPGRSLLPMATPQPPPALPVVPPPVDHPAYLGQPLMPNGSQPAPAPAGPVDGGPVGPADEPDPAEVRAREFLAKRIKGKDLKRAVERVVADLRWHEKLGDAKAASAASGKPLLWVHALGEIDGFA